jgi:xanthine dehydrogenase C subunit
MAMEPYPSLDFHRQVWQPRKLSEAWQLKQRFADQAVFASGGTWLRTQWESGAASMPPQLISLEAIPELCHIREDEAEIRIGSAVTLAACIRDPHIPELLKDACRNIAAPSVRNIGTIGGNVMSAVGDSLPAMLAAGAVLIWFNGQTTTSQSAAEWLQQRRAQSHLKEPRLLIEVKWPKVAPAVSLMVYRFYEKLGRREAFCPSVVSVAGEIYTDSEGIIHNIRLAAGSAAAMAIRLSDAEALLQGKKISPELIQHIHRSITLQFDGGSDPFASSTYRKRAAANFIAASLWSRFSSK